MAKNRGNKQRIPADRHPLHPEKKLVTRRDFISAGLMSGMGAVVMPTVLDMILLERSARAGECPTSSAFPGTIPYLLFDCAGGASLSGNWVVKDAEGAAGQPLASYSRLGLRDTNSFDMAATTGGQFGAPMAAPLAISPDIQSQIYNQLALLDPAIRANVRMGILCHTSLSDSSTNLLSPISLVTEAGYQGTRVKSGLGMRPSPSAGNQDAASLKPQYKPMGISSVESLSTALSYGPAFQGLPVGVKDAIAKALFRLSDSQGKSLLSLNFGDQLAFLAGCGFDKNKAFTGDANDIDPRSDSVMQTVFGITPGQNGSSQDVVVATIVKCVLEGKSGPGVITIDGCDYHSGNRTDGDNKDTEIGMRIAQAIRAAALKGKPLFFQVSTDGGISSDDGSRNWRGDDNDKSLTVIGMYDPAGPRDMLSTQIGKYTAGQNADRSTFIGTIPENVAQTVFLNYLAACGQIDRYATICQDRMLIPASKVADNSLLIFPNKKG